MLIVGIVANGKLLKLMIKITQMEKQDLINKITDRWTDNIYNDIVDILETYTIAYDIEEEEEIVDAVISKMINIYK